MTKTALTITTGIGLLIKKDEPIIMTMIALTITTGIAYKKG